jgi:hypothetical protein
MIAVYTTVHAFTTATAETFQVGGSHTDLLETDDFSDDIFQQALVWLSSENMTTSQKWEYMNETYGDFQGVKLIGNWLDTGYYYCWGSYWNNQFDHDCHCMIDWKFEKYLDGTLSASDVSFQESAGQVLGSVWDAMGYVTGLLTFNIAGSTLSDGSSIPVYLTFIPLFMVLIPWIMIILWIFPYAIEIVKAIGGLIPFA